MDNSYISYLIKINSDNKQKYLIVNDNSFDIINKIIKINVYKNLYLIYDNKKYYSKLIKRGVPVNDMNHLVLLQDDNDYYNLSKIKQIKMDIIYLRNIYPYNRFICFLYNLWIILRTNGYLIIDLSQKKQTLKNDNKQIIYSIKLFTQIYSSNIKIILKKNIYILQKIECVIEYSLTNDINKALKFINNINNFKLQLEIKSHNYKLELDVKYIDYEPIILKSHGYTDEYKNIINDIHNIYNSKSKYNEQFKLFNPYLLIFYNKDIPFKKLIKHIIDNIGENEENKYNNILNLLLKLVNIIGNYPIYKIDNLTNFNFNKKRYYDILAYSTSYSDINMLFKKFIDIFNIENIGDNLYSINSNYYSKNSKKYDFIKLYKFSSNNNKFFYLFYLVINNQSIGGSAMLGVNVINKYIIDIIILLSKYYDNVNILQQNRKNFKEHHIDIELHNFKGISNKDLSNFYNILIKLENNDIYIDRLLKNTDKINKIRKDIIQFNKNVIEKRVDIFNNINTIVDYYLYSSNQKIKLYINDTIFKKQLDIFLEDYTKYNHLIHLFII
jgi:hypothetical protein